MKDNCLIIMEKMHKDNFLVKLAQIIKNLLRNILAIKKCHKIVIDYLFINNIQTIYLLNLIVIKQVTWKALLKKVVSKVNYPKMNSI